MSTTEATKPLIFDVAGMDCGDCAKSVERVVGQLPGVRAAAVSFGTGILTVDSELDGSRSGSQDELERAIGSAVDRAGYTAMVRSADGSGRMAEPAWWQNRKVVPSLIATVLWVTGLIATTVTSPIVLYALAIAIGGWPIARSALAALRVRRLDMNVLMTISVIGAVALGDWSEAGLVVVLFGIGTTLQAITFDRTRRAIRSMLDLAPESANLVRDGIEMEVSATSLRPGDLIRVRPGERIAADGKIIEGRSAVIQAAITGESMPVDRVPGEEVFAGTINGSGALLISVTHPSSASMLANIVNLVERAQATRAPSQQMIDRFAAIYTPVVVVIAIALFLVGWAVTNDVATWTYRALVLLVIACPCALVISTPVSIVSAIGSATRAGILVKGGAALEGIGRVKVVAMDKTGTITIGRPRVVAINSAPGHSETDVLAAAAAVERSSTHPLAHAIVAKALHDDVSVLDTHEFQETAGLGAQAVVNGRLVAVGSDRFLVEKGATPQSLTWISEQAKHQAESGATVLSVAACDGSTLTLLGTIAIADAERPGVREVIAEIHREGVPHVVMLTGDRPEVATSIARSVGIDDSRGGLLPHEKADAITEFRAHGPVAMIGDGVNDAPALAIADVGVAMGIGGTDIALESADLALMQDDLRALPTLLRLSRRTHLIISQNIALSLITKLAALTLGTLGFVNLWIAVLVDVGTSLIVTLNALRLARSVDREPTALDGQS